MYMFMTPFASHIWCLDHLDGLTHLSCISRLTKMSKMTNTFQDPLMRLPLRDDQTGTPRRDMQTDYKDWLRMVETNPCVLIGEPLSSVPHMHRCSFV